MPRPLMVFRQPLAYWPVSGLFPLVHGPIAVEGSPPPDRRLGYGESPYHECCKRAPSIGDSCGEVVETGFKT
jgi:hypothetical protein